MVGGTKSAVLRSDGLRVAAAQPLSKKRAPTRALHELETRIRGEALPARLCARCLSSPHKTTSIPPSGLRALIKPRRILFIHATARPVNGANLRRNWPPALSYAVTGPLR